MMNSSRQVGCRSWFDSMAPRERKRVNSQTVERKDAEEKCLRSQKQDYVFRIHLT